MHTYALYGADIYEIIYEMMYDKANKTLTELTLRISYGWNNEPWDVI